jgi:4-aminobutyrate aminotransferase / (S)-3-amino-2-methylpropionate transaminase / 5-aminovalerate transaminase
VIQQICRKYGILFVADEVQTGFGRTGSMFACEHYGIVPDLLISAKSVAAGLPLAGVTGRAEIMDAPGVGGLGGTYGGNPLACAAALASIETMEKENLSARAMKLGDVFEARTRVWKTKWPLIGEARGLGAMRALELVKSQETREPAKEETEQILKFCRDKGLIVLSAGTYSNVIRLLVPLVISDEQFDEGLNILESAIAHVAESHAVAETRLA